MTTVQELLKVADDAELAVLGRLIERAVNRPRIVVTLQEGGRQRRYLVDRSSEDEFDDVPDGPVSFPRRLGHYFGGAWLRGPGRVDEMHRSLAMSEVVKVERKATV